MFNVHLIDTRGVEDKLGCIECRCDLYNVTRDQNGQALKPDYVGGLSCYDGTKCRAKEGFLRAARSVFLKYTVKYVDWDDSGLPVKIFMLDVTDTWKSSKEPGRVAGHVCQVSSFHKPVLLLHDVICKVLLVNATNFVCLKQFSMVSCRPILKIFLDTC